MCRRHSLKIVESAGKPALDIIKSFSNPLPNLTNVLPKTQVHSHKGGGETTAANIHKDGSVNGSAASVIN